MEPVQDCASSPRARAASRRGSVVAWRGLEHDSLELGERLAAETECGLKALEAELTGVQRPSELVERRTLVVAYLVARSLQQDQVSWAPQAMREAHVAFALLSIEALEWENDGLPSLQPLENGACEQFADPLLDLGLRDSTGKQRSHPSRCERGTTLLDDSLGEPGRLRCLGADDDKQAPGRVAQPMRGSENAAADRDVHWARRSAMGARPLR